MKSRWITSICTKSSIFQILPQSCWKTFVLWRVLFSPDIPKIRLHGRYHDGLRIFTFWPVKRKWHIHLRLLCIRIFRVLHSKFFTSFGLLLAHPFSKMDFWGATKCTNVVENTCLGGFRSIFGRLVGPTTQQKPISCSHLGISRDIVESL